MDIAGIILALATFLTALGAFIVTIRNSQKANEAKVAAEEAKEIAQTKGDTAVAAAEATKIVAEESKAIIIAINGEVFELGKHVNGRLSELLETTKALAKANGIEKGRELQKDNDKKDNS